MADPATDPSVASGPWLFLFRRSPYSSQAAQEALDTLLVAAAYDRPVRVLFLDEAVLQLVAAQTLTSLGLKSQAKRLSQLPLYDVSEIYASQRSLREYALTPDELVITLTPLDDAAIHSLIAGSAVVLND